MNGVLYKNITSRLGIVSRRYLFVSTALAFWSACAVGAGFIVVFALVESFRYLPPPVRKFLFFSVISVTALVFCSVLLYRLLSRPGTDEIARMVESRYPHLKDRLISAVQLGRLDEAALKGQSGNLVDALISKVEEETRAVDMAQSVPAQQLIAWARITLGTVLLALVLSVIVPDTMLGGLYRLIDYSHAYVRPGNVTIYTAGRDDAIIRGDNFCTKGFVTGGNDETLNVIYRWDDSDVWSMKPVDVDRQTGTFAMTLEKPRTSFLYYLEMASFTTLRHRITVIDRPVVEQLSLAVTYPSYTGLGTVERNDNDGNIRALSGTEARLSVTVNKPVGRMALHWSDSTVTECAVDGFAGKASFTVIRDIDYYIGLTDTLGIKNSNPISYRITCIEDENPAVVILSPASDVILPHSNRFPVVYRARDDFGLSSVILNFQLPYETDPRQILLKKGSNEKDILEEYDWNLSGMNLLPDDEVTYCISVYDNDTVGGPKKGVSETRTVRVPSITDLLSETIQEQETGLEKLRKMTERTGRRDEELDKLKKNIMSGEEMDWSEKNALDEAQKDFGTMQQELKDLSEALKQGAERLSDEDVTAMETFEKMQNISEMMDKLAEGEFKEALKRLSEAASSLNPEKVKKALENFEISAEMIKEKLDRFISLLEQVMALQSFEMAQKILEEIAFRQAEIAEQYNKDSDSAPAHASADSTLAREQESLSSEMENLQKEIGDVAGELSEKFPVDTGPLESLLDSTDVSANMKETATRMMNNDTEAAEQSLEQSNEMLSDLRDAMEQLGNAMKSSNTAEMKKRLFKAVAELLALSGIQEQIIDEASSTGHEILAKRELEVIDGLQKTKRSLADFSAVFVEITGVLDQLMTSAEITSKTALDSFASGNPEIGEKEARRTLSTLNSTVHFLSMLLNNSSGEGSGMPGDIMEQLRNIASGELSLQMQMGQGISEEMLARMAAEQEKLAQMLSDLGRKIAGDKRLQEVLEKLVEEMDDTAGMMRMNEDRELIERSQLDIYRRLLDARRSRRERDLDTKRKSWTAKRDISLGADELASDRGEKQLLLNERIKKAMNDDFNPEYIRLIRSYFESMLKDKDNVEVMGR